MQGRVALLRSFDSFVAHRLVDGSVSAVYVLTARITLNQSRASELQNASIRKVRCLRDDHAEQESCPQARLVFQIRITQIVRAEFFPQVFAGNPQELRGARPLTLRGGERTQ